MAVPQKNPSYVSAVDEGSGTNTLSTASEVLMAANPDRQYCRIKNLDGTIIISVALGETAVTLEGIVLSPLETWEMPSHSIYTGAINVVAASATPVVAFVEW